MSGFANIERITHTSSMVQACIISVIHKIFRKGSMTVKILALILAAVLIPSAAQAHTIFAPAGKTLKVHWAVLQSAPGKMPDIAAISSRTVAKFTPNEPGSYALYGAVDRQNPDIMRILEVYEDEEAYEIHRASEGFKSFIEERKPILSSLTILPVVPVVLEQKKEGTGKSVLMRLVTVKPGNLDEFKAAITQEYSRAVAEVPGVMAMFATSETGERSNVIHTLEAYTDDEAMREYIQSEGYISYRKKRYDDRVSRRFREQPR